MGALPCPGSIQEVLKVGSPRVFIHAGPLEVGHGDDAPPARLQEGCAREHLPQGAQGVAGEVVPPVHLDGNALVGKGNVDCRGRNESQNKIRQVSLSSLVKSTQNPCLVMTNTIVKRHVR